MRKQGIVFYYNFAVENNAEQAIFRKNLKKQTKKQTMEAENFRQQLRKTCMEFIVLQTIRQKRRYAPDIIAELRNASLIVVEGTLYPMLTRLKNNGILSYEWEESPQGPPRKYYSLTPRGVEYLEALEREWKNIGTIVKKVKNTTNKD